MSNSVLVTLTTDFTLSLQEVKDEFNLKAGEIDEQFGVVPLSHAEDTEQVYCVNVPEEVGTRMQNQGSKLFKGLFSNPKIG
jgi:hypothetical protein